VASERTPFLQSAGEPGALYEQLRADALHGADGAEFQRWGMTSLVPEYAAVGGWLWSVRRVRASRRAGEVSVEELLRELGVLRDLCGSAVEREEAVS
jgi:hypothetical protein